MPFKYAMSANLADNSRVLLPVHEALILWNGEEREVSVLAAGRRPLLGTALLEENELVVQFTEGGLVSQIPMLDLIQIDTQKARQRFYSIEIGVLLLR